MSVTKNIRFFPVMHIIIISDHLLSLTPSRLLISNINSSVSIKDMKDLLNILSPVKSVKLESESEDGTKIMYAELKDNANHASVIYYFDNKPFDGRKITIQLLEL